MNTHSLLQWMESKKQEKFSGLVLILTFSLGFCFSPMMFYSVTMFLLLFCRSLVCHLVTARPQDCCWLQEWDGDRRPSTSSHHGIQMSLLLSNIETASPLVMNHTHSTCICTFRHIHTFTGPAWCELKVMKVLHHQYACTQQMHACTRTTQSDTDLTSDSSGQLHKHPMLMRHLGCLALHKIHACLHNMYSLHT